MPDRVVKQKGTRMAKRRDQGDEVVRAPGLMGATDAAANGQMAEAERIFVRELRGRYSEIYKKLFEEPRVYPSTAVEWHGGPQAWNKNVMHPGNADVTQLFHCHVEALSPGGRSQKHGHMNSAVFYILEGAGYDVHDGVRHDWQAGDICIVEPGCVHQHFNASGSEEASMLVLKAKPLFLFANLGFQRLIEGFPKDPVPGFESFRPKDLFGLVAGEAMDETAAAR